MATSCLAMLHTSARSAPSLFICARSAMSLIAIIHVGSPREQSSLSQLAPPHPSRPSISGPLSLSYRSLGISPCPHLPFPSLPRHLYPQPVLLTAHRFIAYPQPLSPPTRFPLTPRIPQPPQNSPRSSTSPFPPTSLSSPPLRGSPSSRVPIRPSLPCRTLPEQPD